MSVIAYFCHACITVVNACLGETYAEKKRLEPYLFVTAIFTHVLNITFSSDECF